MDINLYNTKNILKIIKNVISNYDITKQDDLVSILKSKYNISISQTSVSRYLKKSNIRKVNNIYALDDKSKTFFKLNKIKPFLENNILELGTDINYFYVKTQLGYSSCVIIELKKIFKDKIISTLSNDNIILVFTPDKDTSIEIINYLERYI